MSKSVPSDEELFPDLIHSRGLYRTERTYRVDAWEALQAVKESKEKELQTFRFTSRQNLDSFRRELNDAWLFADARVSRSVLAGYVDGFPDIWFGIGKGLVLGHHDTDDSAKEVVTDKAGYAIDYFAGAKQCLTTASSAASPSALPKPDPEKTSALYSVAAALFAAVDAKILRYRPRLRRLLIPLLGAAVVLAMPRLGLPLSPDQLAFATTAAQVGTAILAAFVVIAEIVWFVRVTRLASWPKRYLAQDSVSLAQRRADAYKLLRYYQLWREDLRKRMSRGYKVFDYQVHDVTPACAKHMDEAIAELEKLIENFDNLYRL